MAFLIVSIVIISAVAAFLLLKKQNQAPIEQPVKQPAAPVVPEVEKVVEVIEPIATPEQKATRKTNAVKQSVVKQSVVKQSAVKKPVKKAK
jgi:hypothetical protein